MGSRVRAIVGTAVVLATAAFPAGALANASGSGSVGPVVSTAAQQGGIGASASTAAGFREADNSVLLLLGATPPGNTPEGPIHTPICGPGCGTPA